MDGNRPHRRPRAQQRQACSRNFSDSLSGVSEHTSVSDRVHYHPNLIFSVGTQVVTLVDIPGAAGLVMHPRGAVGVVVRSPTDLEHSYRVRFPDGFETPLKRSEVTMLARFKEGEPGDSDTGHFAQSDLYQR